MSVDLDTSPTSPSDAPDAETSSRRRPKIFSRHFSRTGLVVAGLFLALSMTPSLLPRTGPIQGVLSGVSLMLGYAIGTSAAAFLRYLQVPRPSERVRRVTFWTAVALVVVLIGLSIYRYGGWQNDIRGLLSMPPLTASHWSTIVPVTVVVALVLLLIARSLRSLYHVTIARLTRRMPPRVATTLGVALLSLVIWLLVSGLLVQGFWAGANAVFAPRNNIDKPGVSGPPTSSLRSGGPSSLVTWDSLGREGRAIVSLGPTQEDIQTFDPSVPAKEPIRVFAGLDSADSYQARADLVLAELKRTGAFDREALMIASTTGSGFLDPGAIDSFEYLLHGDTAIASAQYSYLPSWLSLLADSEKVLATSRTLFNTVYDYVQTLPEDERPKIYVYGLSLGSYGASSVVGSIELLNQPIDGALLAGPPFINPLHQRLLAERDPTSPPWRPVLDNGLTVRFTSQEPYLLELPGPWGPTRIAYLQHGSDPIVWFSPDLTTESPEWLAEGNRAPDVSDELAWTPLVFMWQVLADIPAAGAVPYGHGHNYSPTESVYSWAAVTDVPGWTDAELARLSVHVTEQIAADASPIA